MDYAILHIGKYKKLGAIGAHIDRTHTPNNVDKEKTFFNEEFVTPEQNITTLAEDLGTRVDKSVINKKEEKFIKIRNPLEVDVQRRIAEGYTKDKTIRSDAVLALGVILSGSHVRMKEIEQDKALFESWKEENYNFACREFGKENIVRMTLHLDEKTPHFHCVMVPITEDGRLCGADWTQNKDMRDIQTSYGKAMNKYGLHRGKSSKVTDRKHYTTKDFYQKDGIAIEQANNFLEKVTKESVHTLENTKSELKDELVSLYRDRELDKIKYKNYPKTDERRYDQLQKINNYQEKLNYIKSEIPISSFAQSHLGYIKDKEKSSGKWIALKHSIKDKILVLNRPNSQGHYMYKIADQDRSGGTLVDLLRKEHGWDWQKVRDLSNLEPVVNKSLYLEKSIPQNDSITDPLEQTKEATKKLKSIRTSSEETYLSKRGIRKTKRSSPVFDQLVTDKNNAIFGLYTDFNKYPGGRLCSTLHYKFNEKGGKEKKFQWKLPKGLSVLKKGEGRVKEIIITESPIDALSYSQLFKEQEGTMYVSTCGTLTKKGKEDLSDLIDANKGVFVRLAFDNDKYGLKLTKELGELLIQKGQYFRAEVPQDVKDWNDALVYQQTGEKKYLLSEQGKKVIEPSKSEKLLTKFKSILTKQEVKRDLTRFHELDPLVKSLTIDLEEFRKRSELAQRIQKEESYVHVRESQLQKDSKDTNSHLSPLQTQSCPKKKSNLIEDPLEQAKEAEKKFDKVIHGISDILLNKRGISDRTFSDYAPYLRSNSEKAIFKLYTEFDKHPEGRLCSTLQYELKGKEPLISKSQWRLPKGLSILRNRSEEIQNIVITESPLDSLSHKEFSKNSEGTMYISTCGKLSVRGSEDLKNILNRNPEAEVSIIFNNEEESSQVKDAFYRLVKDLDISNDIKTYPIKAISKTLNDYLLYKKTGDSQYLTLEKEEDFSKIIKESTTPKVSSSGIEKRKADFIKDPEEQTKEALKKFKSIKKSEKDPYLSKVYGLKKSVFTGYEDVLSVNSESAIFKQHADFAKNPEGRLCSTFLAKQFKDLGNYEKHQWRLPKGLCVLKRDEKIEKIVLTKTPISSLSHSQLNGEEKGVMYISTCGILSKDSQEDLKLLFERNKAAKITLALDNDEVGYTVMRQASKILKEQEKEFKVEIPPKTKDWNSTLLYEETKAPNLLIEEDTKREIEERFKKEEIKSCDYNDSYLKVLGINEEVYKDLDCIKTTKEKVHFVMFNSEKRYGHINNILELSGEAKKINKKVSNRYNSSLVILNKVSIPKKVIVSNDPLELLNQRQLQQSKLLSVKEDLVKYNSLKEEYENTMYISTCGNNSRTVQKALEERLEEAKEKGAEILTFNKKVDYKIKLITDPKEQTAEALGKFESIKKSEKDPYLSKVYGLNKSVFTGYDEVLSVNSQNAIFKLYTDFDKNPEGRLCSTFLAKEFEGLGKYEKHQWALPKGLCVLQRDKEIEKIVLTKTPLGSLSHSQLNGEEKGVMYISTCGILSKESQEDLKSLFEQNKAAKITLALDNDEVGYTIMRQASKILKEQEKEFKVEIPPKTKDWNSTLLYEKTNDPNLLLEEDRKIDIETKFKEAEIEKCENKDSFLNSLGIDEEVYKDFDCIKTTKEKVHFVMFNSEKRYGHVNNRIELFEEEEKIGKKVSNKYNPSLVILNEVSIPKKVIVSNDALELLNQRQLQKNELISVKEDLEKYNSLKEEYDNTMYISTCGNNSRTVQKGLEERLQEAKEKGAEILTFNKKVEYEMKLITDPEEQTKEALEKFESIKKSEKNPYLSKAYGLEKSVFTGYDEVLSVNSQNAIFKLYTDFDENPEGRLCSTFLAKEYEDLGRYEKPQWALPKGLCILKRDEEINKIVLTKTPIESLSHSQLNGEEEGVMYISTCGILSKESQKDLESLFEQNKEAEITLALDNDEVGYTVMRQASKILKEQEKEFKVEIPPKTKNWNNTLLYEATNDPNLLIEEDKKIDIEEKFKKEELKSCNYKESFLKGLGIDETTYREFDCIQTSKHKVHFTMNNSEERYGHVNNILELSENEGDITQKVSNKYNPSMVILNEVSNPKRVIVCKDPLELLHQRQQHRNELRSIQIQGKMEKDALEKYKDVFNNTMYISTCGNNTKTNTQALEERLEVAKEKGAEIQLMDQEYSREQSLGRVMLNVLGKSFSFGMDEDYEDFEEEEEIEQRKEKKTKVIERGRSL